MVMVSDGLPLECMIMMLCSMSENLGERKMDLTGRPSNTMPNGVIIGYLYKGTTPLLPASN